uniref:Secreted protein n=1 Tax=Achlya hypogyna TaxID=1202772 RepID=A0A0A7CMZ7_ACHHY|nr:secreted protein [Achlya hypogyna]
MARCFLALVFFLDFLSSALSSPPTPESACALREERVLAQPRLLLRVLLLKRRLGILAVALIARRRSADGHILGLLRVHKRHLLRSISRPSLVATYVVGGGVDVAGCQEGRFVLGERRVEIEPRRQRHLALCLGPDRRQRLGEEAVEHSESPVRRGDHRARKHAVGAGLGRERCQPEPEPEHHVLQRARALLHFDVFALNKGREPLQHRLRDALERGFVRAVGRRHEQLEQVVHVHGLNSRRQRRRGWLQHHIHDVHKLVEARLLGVALSVAVVTVAVIVALKVLEHELPDDPAGGVQNLRRRGRAGVLQRAAVEQQRDHVFDERRADALDAHRNVHELPRDLGAVRARRLLARQLAQLAQHPDVPVEVLYVVVLVERAHGENLDDELLAIDAVSAERVAQQLLHDGRRVVGRDHARQELERA